MPQGSGIAVLSHKLVLTAILAKRIDLNNKGTKKNKGGDF
jgi:hypothetical protein